jgi:hypothetical protein
VKYSTSDGMVGQLQDKVSLFQRGPYLRAGGKLVWDQYAVSLFDMCSYFNELSFTCVFACFRILAD